MKKNIPDGEDSKKKKPLSDQELKRALLTFTSMDVDKMSRKEYEALKEKLNMLEK